MGSQCFNSFQKTTVSTQNEFRNEMPKNIKFSKDNFIFQGKKFYDFYDIDTKISNGVNNVSLYKVIHKETGQMRCAKIFRAIKADSSHRQEIKMEIKMIQYLDHPHICKIYEYFMDERTIYIIMEYLEGGDLFEALTNKPEYFSEENIAKYFQQIFSCVSYLHSKKICHRDLKPENILFENKKHENIKLIDFGTSIFLNENDYMGDIKGTAFYIAPEVLNKQYNEKCDIWSCGIILYLALSGKLPFIGKNEQEIFDKIIKNEINFEEKIWEQRSPEVKDLLKKMLERNFLNRFSASDCLNHQWIKDRDFFHHAKELNTSTLFAMANFQALNFERVAQQYLLNQINTSTEIEELRVTFEAMDQDGNGLLDRGELLLAYSKIMTREDAEETVNHLLNNIDTNNNGEIDYNEFLLASINRRNLYSEESLQRAFKKLDIGNKGFISVESLKRFCGNVENNENNFYDQILKEFDGNNNEEIEYEEFKNGMLKYASKKLSSNNENVSFHK